MEGSSESGKWGSSSHHQTCFFPPHLITPTLSLSLSLSQFTPKCLSPPDLETLFSAYKNDPEALIVAFMPVFCDHVKADRIFMQPRNPDTRVCKVLRWRRGESIPWPAIPLQKGPGEWFVEDEWEKEDPLWRAAMHLKPSIYVEDLEASAKEGILNIEFENKYMFHTAFIHGHAHFPPLNEITEQRKFYGSVQPAVFDGPRVWDGEVRELVEKCLVRIAPFMKAVGEMAPGRETFADRK